MPKLTCFCGHTGEFAADLAGKVATCTQCGNRLFIPPPGKFGPKRKVRIRANVVGVFANNPDGSSRGDIIEQACAMGMPVLLDREPSNPVHIYAVKVYLPVSGWGPLQIGYLPEIDAEQICDHLEAGCRVEARVIRLEPNRQTPRVRVEIDVYPGD